MYELEFPGCFQKTFSGCGENSTGSSHWALFNLSQLWWKTSLSPKTLLQLSLYTLLVTLRYFLSFGKATALNTISWLFNTEKIVKKETTRRRDILIIFISYPLRNYNILFLIQGKYIHIITQISYLALSGMLTYCELTESSLDSSFQSLEKAREKANNT